MVMRIGSFGSDRLEGGSGIDRLIGLSGDDLLMGGSGDDFLFGNDGRDVLVGGSGADTLRGGRGADLLAAGSGSDDLDGGFGNDRLFAGSGADTLRGGLGADTLNGGSGADRFFYDDRFEFGDTIQGFDSGIDRLVFSRQETWPDERPPAGPLDPDSFAIGEAPEDGDDFFIWNPATRTLSFDPDGNGALFTLEIAHFERGEAPDTADIFLV